MTFESGIIVNKPKISVIMPIHNIEKVWDYAKLAFIYISKQTYDNIELIIICDGALSKDIGHAVRFKGFFKHRPDSVKIYASQTQLGPEMAKNYGFLMSTGDLVTFHDQDDYSDIRRMEKLNNGMGNDFVIMSEVLEQGYRNRVCKYDIDFAKCIINKKLKTPHCSSFLIKKSYFSYLGGFEGDFSDFKFSTKLMLFRGMFGFEKIPVISEPLYTYNRHFFAQSRQKPYNSKRKLFDRELYKTILPSVVETMGNKLSGDNIKEILMMPDTLPTLNTNKLVFIE